MVTLRKKAAAVAAGIAEGNYTSWTKVWTRTITDGLYHPFNYDFFIDDLNDIVLFRWLDTANKGRLGLYKLIDGSVIFESNPSEIDYAPSYNQYAMDVSFGFSSLTGTSRSLQSYYCIMAFTPGGVMEIEVRRGSSTPLWIHDVAPDCPGFMVDSFAISATGEWIIIGCGENQIFTCYKGS